MKLNANNQDHINKIACYLSNEMSDRERIDFETMVLSDPDNQAVFQELKSIWSLSAKARPTVNTNAAWENVKARLDLDLLPTKSKKIRSFSLMAISAMVALLLAVGIFFTQRKDDLKVVIHNRELQSLLVHTLNDGSIVYLSGNSQISYSESYNNFTRVVELNGEAFFDVVSDSTSPFLIYTLKANVKVLGTSFLLSANANNPFKLCVSSGVVHVLSEHSETSILATVGDRVIFNNSHFVKEKVENDFNPLSNNQLHFKEESLHNVARVMNKIFGTSIYFEPNSLGNRTITTTFSTQSIETITEIICVTMNLKSTKTKNTIIFSSSNKIVD